MKMMSLILITMGAMPVLAAVSAGSFRPSTSCSAHANQTAIQYSSTKNLIGCVAVGSPYFDTNTGPTSGNVSVELQCSGTHVEVVIKYRGEANGDCSCLNPKFWNP